VRTMTCKIRPAKEMSTPTCTVGLGIGLESHVRNRRRAYLVAASGIG
jgi:hypothetical protein